MERKEHKVCFHCLHNHARDMKYICDIKGEIKIPWEVYVKSLNALVVVKLINWINVNVMMMLKLNII